MNRISQSARLLAKVVRKSHKQNPSLSLDDLISAKNFHLVVEITCQMSIDKPEQSLNVGKSIGLLLNHVAIKNSVALRNGDTQKSLNAVNFKKLHKAEWN